MMRFDVWVWGLATSWDEDRMGVSVIEDADDNEAREQAQQSSDEEEGIVDSNMPSRSCDGARTPMEVCGRL